MTSVPGQYAGVLNKLCTVTLSRLEGVSEIASGDSEDVNVKDVVGARRRSLNKTTADSGQHRIHKLEEESTRFSSAKQEPTFSSPVLSRLKNGSLGQSLEETQKILLNKHHAAKSRVDAMCIGGGVSMWPNMHDMRLTTMETLALLVTSLLLCVATIWLFFALHGDLLLDLLKHHRIVSDFAVDHPLIVGMDNHSFVASVLTWHSDYRQIVSDIHANFDMSLADASAWYLVSISIYIIAILTLLYYLADNVLAKSRLTPWRIKQWVSLLVVTATWTLLSVYLLYTAQCLETAVRANVHKLNEQLGDLVLQSVDLTTFRHVLFYWTTRCLLMTSPSLLSIMGLIAVSDIVYYLQYYSLPVLMALLMPVARLIWSLADVYRPR